APTCLSACESGSGNACFTLAAMYEHGLSVEQNAATAAEYYRLACAKKDAAGCRKASEVAEVERKRQAEELALSSQRRQETERARNILRMYLEGLTGKLWGWGRRTPHDGSNTINFGIQARMEGFNDCAASWATTSIFFTLPIADLDGPRMTVTKWPHGDAWLLEL